MRNLLLLSLICAFIFSCSETLQVSQFKAVPGGSWSKDSPIEFTFTEVDTINNHNIFILLRNDEQYLYSNLFLITELGFPNGETIRDTLEYEMATPSGQWLGKGFGSIKENKLWYKENIVFPVNGVYTLQISHAMRKIGSVNGIADLYGITDIGFEIEKSE
ncbi:MAG: gliding motility lipoprotein GldH [Eudoraea sp.]|nr:gliding motility lipoprotein GldH [Eudoraea sp.]